MGEEYKLKRKPFLSSNFYIRLELFSVNKCGCVATVVVAYHDWFGQNVRRLICSLVPAFRGLL